MNGFDFTDMVIVGCEKELAGPDSARLAVHWELSDVKAASDFESEERGGGINYPTCKHSLSHERSVCGICGLYQNWNHVPTVWKRFFCNLVE